MSGLIDALLAGAGFSLLAGGVAWLVCRGFTRIAGPCDGGWRAARWAVLLPLLLAPVIHVLPAGDAVPAGHAPGLR